MWVWIARVSWQGYISGRSSAAPLEGWLPFKTVTWLWGRMVVSTTMVEDDKWQSLKISIGIDGLGHGRWFWWPCSNYTGFMWGMRKCEILEVNNYKIIWFWCNTKQRALIPINWTNIRFLVFIKQGSKSWNIKDDLRNSKIL